MGIRRAPYQWRTAPFLKALCSHALLLCSQGYNMPISSVLCRTQEALQRERAAGASLDNVRTQAIRAATAWGREAALAERLEQNRAASRSGAKTVVRTIHVRDEQSEFRILYENPDPRTTPHSRNYFISTRDKTPK